jgi:HSP20 family protein
MTLVRWRPFNEVVNIQDEINRVFDDVWRGARGRGAGAWYPSVDLMENPEEFKLVAELPGLTKDDVKITLSENLLTLQGEKKAEREEKNENWHHVERSYGKFERSFQLTSAVDPAKVTAKFKDGVLSVVLPKSEDSRSRDIQIQS